MFILQRYTLLSKLNTKLGTSSRVGPFAPWRHWLLYVICLWRDWFIANIDYLLDMKAKKKTALKCIIAAIAASQLKKERTEWVKPWLKRREFGVCSQLLKELCREDSFSFKNYLRCDPPLFSRLLLLVKENIVKENTVMRSSITVEERLAVTLRYLATGIMIKHILL